MTGADVAEADSTSLKLALLGLACASIEWYDFFIYATAAALIFPGVFFAAKLPPLVALIASFSTFAVGFVARPIGALLFGHIGDKVGRKTALVGALLLMGAASTLIGLLPPYRIAGILAPVALVALRLMQGLAVGGQWGGAMLLAMESAPKSRRGLYGSIAQAGVPVGVVLSNLAFFIANRATSPEAFMAYGWRIPFVFSIVLVGLGMYIHFRMEDTEAFRRLRQAARPADGAAPHQGVPPLLDALRSYPGLILLAAGAYVSTNLNFYIVITYVVAYATSAEGLHMPRGTLLSAVLIANVVLTPVMFLAGALSDRYGRRVLFMSGVALTAVWAFVLFPLTETRSMTWIMVAILVGGIFSSLTYGPMAAMFAELYDTRVRYSAISLSYQLGAIAGGGLAPIIATALYAKFHSNFWVSVYVAAACALSLTCAGMLKETRFIDLAQTASASASSKG